MRTDPIIAVMRRVLWVLAHLVLPLRYRVRLHGRERLRGLKPPVLMLPNHPGYIDPVLVLGFLYYPLRPRPLLYEDNFRTPSLRVLASMLGAVPIPELDRPSREALERTEHAVAEVIDGLRRGESFVLWPAGRVQRDGVERLGAARALTDILRAVPEASDRPGAHPRGLGQQLHPWLGADAGARALPPPRPALAGGEPAALHAAPARRYHGRSPRPRPTPGTGARRRQPMVRGLVQRRGPGAADLRPVSFPVPGRGAIVPGRCRARRGRGRLDRVRPETRAAVAEILADQLGRPLADGEFNPSIRLEELGLDSLERMDLALAVEQRFGFSVDPAPVTVGQLLALAEGLAEKAAAEAARRRSGSGPPPANEPPRLLGETIPEAFVARALADRHGRGGRRRPVRASSPTNGCSSGRW